MEITVKNHSPHNIKYIQFGLLNRLESIDSTPREILNFRDSEITWNKVILYSSYDKKYRFIFKRESRHKLFDHYANIPDSQRL